MSIASLLSHTVYRNQSRFFFCIYFFVVCLYQPSMIDKYDTLFSISPPSGSSFTLHFLLSSSASFWVRLNKSRYRKADAKPTLSEGELEEEAKHICSGVRSVLMEWNSYMAVNVLHRNWASVYSVHILQDFSSTFSSPSSSSAATLFSLALGTLFSPNSSSSSPLPPPPPPLVSFWLSLHVYLFDRHSFSLSFIHSFLKKKNNFS